MSEANARKELSGILADSTSPFILHVGSNSMYKNRPGLVKIYLELVKLMPDCPRLIMAGDVIPDDLRTLIGENFGSGRIVEVKSPSSLQVDALFSLAEALIFPSLVEGFGVPILEAQATGCPIFSSNRPPLPEVARGAAIHFDPDNISGAAQLIHNNWNLRANLIEQGYRAVEGRTPSDMAARYISLYNRLGSPKR
jgi:glycosyltransferase involved in cell wall biosynthesis